MNGREKVIEMRQHGPCVLPSMLLCDFGNLGAEVERLAAAGFLGLHLDVMDGRFVPNFTYGMPIVRAFRELTSMPLDVHLMIEEPGDYITQFCEAGADAITIHREAVTDPVPALDKIREGGAAAGIAVNPGTPISEIACCEGHVDLVLIMSVDAGFGGQAFNPSVLSKYSQAREIFGDQVVLEGDGGLNASTVASVTEVGAEFLVVGSAIFRKGDYGLALQELKENSQPV